VESGGELIGSAEAAKVLGISRQRFHKMVRVDGMLHPAVDRPRTMLFRRAEVDRLAREGWPGRRQRQGSDPSTGYPDLADDPGLNEDAAREAWETPGMGS
jgi:excisionase family DNA binding protein